MARSAQKINLSTELQRRLLLATRSGQLDMIDFPEIQPVSDELPKPSIDLSSFTPDEVAQFWSLNDKARYIPGSGLAMLTKATKLALLKACRLGALDLADVPQLIEAYQQLDVDSSVYTEQEKELMFEFFLACKL